MCGHAVHQALWMQGSDKTPGFGSIRRFRDLFARSILGNGLLLLYTRNGAGILQENLRGRRMMGKGVRQTNGGRRMMGKGVWQTNDRPH
jgi:hypothetical protein